MWSLKCKHQMLTDDARCTTHNDARQTTTDHNSSPGELKTSLTYQEATSYLSQCELAYSLRPHYMRVYL